MSMVARVRTGEPPRPRSCNTHQGTGKARYLTRREAHAAARRRYGKNWRRSDVAGSVTAYHCPTCDGWHIGHKYTEAP